MPPPDSRGPHARRAPLRHHDPLALRTVFVAPKRAERPLEAGGAGQLAACPFCAGHESLTPPAILEFPAATGGGWQARIIPNRYPIVEPCAAPAGPAAAPEPAAVLPAHGEHDVLIESPHHLRSILAVDATHWRSAWELCRRRLVMFADRADLAWACVFKNSGPRAGASLEHVHSQLVGLDITPPAIAAEQAAVAADPDLFARLLDTARARGRVVAEAGDLVALVPPAPRQPHETWILPHSAEAWFHATSSDRVAALAALTRDVIGRLDRLLPGADYNWWLHQAPFAAAPAGWHWHLEILPRVSGIAGFELGTGCHVSELGPDVAAARLRGA